jgi:hypothetical protein
MSTMIPEVVDTVSISSAVFIDLDLDGNVYYISTAYGPIELEGNVYTEQGSLLSVSSLQDDIRTTNGDIQVALSGIPSNQNYMDQVLGTQIKGGTIKIRRVFFDKDTLEVANSYLRYTGVITNFSISEETDFLSGDLVNNIGITCASINTVLENRVRGQRTNGTDRREFYPDDISFDRVKDLQNTTFDFGREFSGGTGYGGGGGGRAGRLSQLR